MTSKMRTARSAPSGSTRTPSALSVAAIGPDGRMCPKHRADHGWAGHRDDGAEDGGRLPADVEHVVSAERTEDACDGDPDRQEVSQHGSASADLVEAQAQPSLEKDERDRQRHEGKKRVAKQRVRVDDVGDGADDHTGHEEQENARQP